MQSGVRILKVGSRNFFNFQIFQELKFLATLNSPILLLKLPVELPVLTTNQVMPVLGNPVIPSQPAAPVISLSDESDLMDLIIIQNSKDVNRKSSSSAKEREKQREAVQKTPLVAPPPVAASPPPVPLAVTPLETPLLPSNKVHENMVICYILNRKSEFQPTMRGRYRRGVG